MLNIEYIKNPDENFYNIIDNEFNKFAIKNGVICNYEPFTFIAKENNELVGI